MIFRFFNITAYSRVFFTTHTSTRVSVKTGWAFCVVDTLEGTSKLLYTNRPTKGLATKTLNSLKQNLKMLNFLSFFLSQFLCFSIRGVLPGHCIASSLHRGFISLIHQTNPAQWSTYVWQPWLLFNRLKLFTVLCNIYRQSPIFSPITKSLF